LRRLPRERLVDLGAEAIRRSPRLEASGVERILAYRSSGGLAVIATARSARIDQTVLAALLRAWFEAQIFNARLREDAEDRRWSRVGRRAACVAHDLAHHLTVASLEIERALTGVPSASDGRWRRALAALAEARELCERSARGADPAAREERIGLLGLLRRAVEEAVSILGRTDATAPEIRCAPDLEIRTDRMFFGRLVRNLVLNALEASPDRHPVLLRAEREPGGEIALAVLDQGRGMAADRRAELLRFGRSGSGGSGVGSASVEECAQALGLELEIETRLGEGTSVRFRLPG